jgi:hypothetical protein
MVVEEPVLRRPDGDKPLVLKVTRRRDWCIPATPGSVPLLSGNGRDPDLDTNPTTLQPDEVIGS